MNFTKSLLEKMLAESLAAVENNVAMLNQLDANIGDGDHGTAILAATRTAAESAKKNEPLNIVLETIGWDVMSSVSGSTSALSGSFFDGMSSAAFEELDTSKTIDMFAAGLKKVQTASKAKVGDKTMLDALIPAITAMKNLQGTGATLPEVFQTAAVAAKEGADSTKDLIAKFGRAKNLGERSKGHLDAGAVSTALIYEAYSKAVQNYRD
jgi:dihydroxyacetone kinase-like protein